MCHYFAPFVASALRDRAITDLLQENEKLRRTKKTLSQIQITGKNRSPIYAKGYLNENYTFRRISAAAAAAASSNSWDVRLEGKESCSLDKIEEIELWIGCAKQGGFSRKLNGEIILGKSSDGTGVICIDFYPQKMTCVEIKVKLMDEVLEALSGHQAIGSSTNNEILECSNIGVAQVWQRKLFKVMEVSFPFASIQEHLAAIFGA